MKNRNGVFLLETLREHEEDYYICFNNMKIKSLNIDSYRHLQNIHFDFTYLEGHANAGKPLDKICIIGQSATGKTSILELIKNSISELDSAKVINGKDLSHYFHSDFSGQVEFLYDDLLQDDNLLQLTKNTIIKMGKSFVPLRKVAVAQSEE